MSVNITCDIDEKRDGLERALRPKREEEEEGKEGREGREGRVGRVIMVGCITTRSSRGTMPVVR